jgi:hypothetical protein
MGSKEENPNTIKKEVVKVSVEKLEGEKPPQLSTKNRFVDTVVSPEVS